ncbi:MAG TPA: LLM class flavin-dependent oxidoreductase, partial [Dehalococcoidia bacterium]|nr:LLM class flavin-dependent oxidoreductase [Dehalococcoidia bacterium]
MAAGPIGAAFASNEVEVLSRQMDRIADIEAWGYDSVWLGEHIMFHLPLFDNITALANVAGRTSTIKVGTGITLLPLRHPTVVAKAAGTLDVVSGGRLIFGIGIGGEFAKEFEAVGVPVNERGARTNESLEVIRRLWTEDHVAFEGRYFQLSDVTMEPKPVQQPHPPIWIAGRSEAAYRRTAKYGDGFLPYLFTPDQYRAAWQQIGEYAAGEGRDPGQLTAAEFLFFNINQDREEAKRALADDMSRRYNMPFHRLIERYCLFGAPDDIAEGIDRYRRAGL